MGLISNGTTIFDNGSMASGFGSNLKFISKATASASASIEFTSGIDSTYKEYVFYFNNIHPQTDNVYFEFQGNASGETGYNETITSTAFFYQHNEIGTDAELSYGTASDQAQGTSFQEIAREIGNGADECLSGYLQLFNPSSTTYVKHFMSTVNYYDKANYSKGVKTAGYFNTTSALTNIKFQMSSGNIDAGEILLFGVN